MKNATRSVRRGENTRLLVVDAKSGNTQHLLVGDLPGLFRVGDVVVVNDVATIPSSLRGKVVHSGEKIEIRLIRSLNHKFDEMIKWQVVLFGEGNWREPTEKRAPPPVVSMGDRFEFAGGLISKVIKVHHEISKRLLEIEFEEAGSKFWKKYYEAAVPTQYSYLENNLEIWDQQTVFSGPPLALEPPSASFPLTWRLLFELQEVGVEILRISHGTGISNTGDPKIDEILPFPEPFRIFAGVQNRIVEALREKRRIIAVGTGVVRALETWAGRISQNEWAWSDLKIGPRHKRTVVAGLITGLHEPGASHLSLLQSFASDKVLNGSYEEAVKGGYLWHEYGDLCLIMD